jgi:hypothetical protein
VQEAGGRSGTAAREISDGAGGCGGEEFLALGSKPALDAHSKG